MLSAESLCVFLLGCLIYSNSGFHIEEVSNNHYIVPWIGVLKLKSGRNRTDAVTGLVLIKKQLAVGNANDVANVKINSLRKYAKAIFNKNHVWWDCAVDDYILHPEYFNELKNTLALVFLSSNREDIYWSPIQWPVYENNQNNIYSIGLTDSHKRLQQFSNRMEKVNNLDCDDFYKREKLDYKSLEPPHNVCYKVLSSRKKCLIDAGMALAVKTHNIWTLIGISTNGPGCSLPSRFIQFLPYLSWIKSHSRPVKTQKSFRRSNYEYEQVMEEPYEDQDTLLLSKLNDTTIVLRPTLSYVKENVYGRCDRIDGVLMYREFGTIRAPTYTATGVYSLSVYDLFFPRVTCVMVTVMCTQRSKITFWFDKGFHQEDIEDLVKTIPAPKRNTTKLPKILYIKDTYTKYRMIKTINLEFKFEFTDEAKLHLEFYGRNVSSPMRPPKVHFLSKQKQTFGHLPEGVDFNAREDEENVDRNDSFYFF